MSWGDQLEDETEGEQTDDTSNMSTIDRLAPDAVSGEQASEMNHKWRLMVWGLPGRGKTHFAYTMPEPVCMIDTERKGESIIDKFDKKIFLWQPTDYDEAKEALEQSIDLLEHYKEEQNQVGTIVVDSMSEMWDLSQQKHVQEHYPGKSVDEVEFQSAFGSGQGDWKIIKRYHNANFRDLIMDTPYHFCWTAMAEPDYNAKMEENLDHTPMTDSGENKNEYRASDIIQVVESNDGKPIGILEKSSQTKHRYSGLEYPTFEKHRDLVERIRDIEVEGGNPIEQLDTDVAITEGSPRYDE